MGWDEAQNFWGPRTLAVGICRECLVQSQRWEFFATLSFMDDIRTLDGRHLKFRDVWATGGWVI